MASCAGDLKTIPERVFCQLREAIVEGEIPAGSKISEADLAQTYGISRGPLREAITQLAVVGLVERRPNVGARVIELSSEQLLDIFHVREALEDKELDAISVATPNHWHSLMVIWAAQAGKHCHSAANVVHWATRPFQFSH